MPYIVPGPTPGTPGLGDYFGQGFSEGANKGLDLLMQAYLAGMLSPTPTQGSYTSPSGATTTLSPAEVSAQNPTIDLSRLLRQQQIPGATVRAAGFPLRFQPDLKRQVEQAQLEKAQLDIQNAPLERRATEALIKQREASANMVPIYDATGNVIGYVPPRSRPAPGAGSKETASLEELTDKFLEHATTSATGPATLPTDLPKTKGLKEGTVVRDPTTRRAIAILQDGTWIPYTE
jgi:hypothetical protein